MYNVLLDELPTSWNGYELNTWYQIGIQLYLLQDDEDIKDAEKTSLIIQLLFGNEDGSLRDYPKDMTELSECVGWFLGGWFTDRHVEDGNEKKKLIDYDVDQWRIYADFLANYRIDLSTSDMHWWLFQGLLWNIPYEASSLMKVIEIRQKKPSKHASPEEKKQIRLGHQRFDLHQKKEEKKFTSDEINAIDAFDELRNKARAMRAEKNELEEEALREFKRK